MGDKQSLKKKTIAGLIWSFSELLANQGIRFVIQIVLARLLLPEDFGLIGMITIFISISQSIIDSGFSNALIRETNPSQKDYSTVFYFNFIMSVVIYITLFMSSRYISVFFNEPRLISIIRVLGVVIIINSFGLIQRTILVRKIDFKTQTKISCISAILSGVVAIIMAFMGAGVWSLVIQTIFMQFIQSLLLCLSNKWIPSFCFSIDSFKRLFGFGWKLLVSGLIDTVYNNLYYLIIGKNFTTNELGYYTNAQKLRDTITQSMTSSVQKVSYPVLSSIKENEDALKNGFKKIIKNSVYFIFPIMIGLVAIANPFIRLLFGEKWIGSILYFQIICISGMLFPLHAINLNILQVKGRSDLYLGIEILKKIIGISLVAIALVMKKGILGLLWASVINSFISYFINSHYSAKLISYSTYEQIKDVTPSFIASVIMGIVVTCSNLILPQNILVRLIVQVLIGASVYIAISKIGKIKEFDTTYELIKSLLKKKRV